MNTLDQEYSELQEYIEIIISTAKLIGHNVSYAPIIIISEQDSSKVLMSFSLLLLQQKVTLITGYKGKKQIFKHHPQEEKMNHLKKLLQAL